MRLSASSVAGEIARHRIAEECAVNRKLWEKTTSCDDDVDEGASSAAFPEGFSSGCEADVASFDRGMDAEMPCRTRSYEPVMICTYIGSDEDDPAVDFVTLEVRATSVELPFTGLRSAGESPLTCLGF